MGASFDPGLIVEALVDVLQAGMPAKLDALDTLDVAAHQRVPAQVDQRLERILGDRRLEPEEGVVVE